MNKAEIEVDEKQYRIGKLNALNQFHVSRRLGPVLAAVGVSLQSLSAGAKDGNLDFAAVLGPASEVMARMSDEDANYVIFTCMNVVQRKQDDRWAPVQSGTSFMFEDIDMPIMIRLVVAVLQENLGNFLRGLSGGISLQGS